MPDKDPMSSSSARIQIVIALIGVAGLLGAAVIANWDKLSGRLTQDARPVRPPSPAPTASRPPSAPAPGSPRSSCVLSGRAFYEETKAPATGAMIDLYPYPLKKESQPVKITVAIVGIDGAFTAYCGDIPASQFPLDIAVRWPGRVHHTGVKVDYGDEKSGINLLVRSVLPKTP